MNAQKVRNVLIDLFGPNVGIGVTDPTSDQYILEPAEHPAVARAVPKRAREFAAGRAAGRQALAGVNHPPVAIPRSQDRSPVWPAGYSGTISHCDSICLAAVCHIKTWRSIGLDVEDTTPLQRDAWSIVLTDREEQQLYRLPPWRRMKRVKTLFSIKEAAYKAQYPLTGQVFDFKTLDVTLDGSAFAATFTQSVGRYQTGAAITGRYADCDGLTLSAAMITDH